LAAEKGIDLTGATRKADIITKMIDSGKLGGKPKAEAKPAPKKEAPKPAAKPAPKPVAKPAPKPAAKPAPKPAKKPKVKKPKIKKKGSFLDRLTQKLRP